MADTGILGNVMPTRVYKPRAELPGIFGWAQAGRSWNSAWYDQQYFGFFSLITNYWFCMEEKRVSRAWTRKPRKNDTQPWLMSHPMADIWPPNVPLKLKKNTKTKNPPEKQKCFFSTV